MASIKSLISRLHVFTNMCGTLFAVVVGILALLGPSCSNSDNLSSSLLLETLKTVQQAVCDDNPVSLGCPRGTTISIQVAQYGKAAPVDQGCVAETSSATSGDSEKKCKRPNSIQYSLLKTVVEACQKKPQCKFSTKLRPGLVDPCPFARKYVDVSYKCRPHEFRSRTVCDNDTVKLSCYPHSRIAIFDAQYGRTAHESIACPQTLGVPDETCTSPYAVEKVMQLCLGERRCQIVTDSNTFQSPCKPHSSPYLKVIYTCVPLGVLNERYESATEKDEMEGDDRTEREDFFDESEGTGEKWREPSVVSPVADTALQSASEVVTETTIKETTYLYHPKVTIERNKDTSETSKIMAAFPYPVYIGIAIIIFIILVFIFIGVRCYLDRRASINSKNGDMFTPEAPNVFNDASSDIDNDVDVSHISGTFYDPIHPDMMLYRDASGTKGTLRAMRPLSTIYPCAGASMYGNVDYVPPQPRDIGFRFTRSRSKEEQMDPEAVTSPKSLGTYSNSRFYYG